MINEQLNNNKTTSLLPIHQYKDIIINTVAQNQVTVICGETGSGKTTQIPQFLFHQFKKIMISQPRRISAITLAERVAQQMQCNIGEEIGYSVRFQQKKSASTRVVFVTDGMAIRELMVGATYDLFILDEAHERSINTDVLLAIFKKGFEDVSYKKGKKPFKLIIMSATIQSSKFMTFFNTNAVINVEGRTYPIDLFNLFQPVQNYLEAAFNAILQIHYQQKEGDILTFLTGEDQIVSLYNRLNKVKEEFKINNLKILMLYSALPHQYQHQIFQRNKSDSERRVILATNIAETSITITGVKFVVDCGFMKVRTYDNSKLIDMLTIVPISKANALQRSGRAGRQAPGKCYRLYLKNSYEELKTQTIPQILRSELSGPILQLKAVGIPQIKDLKFMDQPPNDIVQGCLKMLREIKCISDDSNQEITNYGKQISRIPLPPRLAHLLLLSLEFKCQAMMLSILSILSIDNLFISTAISEKGNKKTNLYEILLKYQPTVSFQTTSIITTVHNNQKSNRVSTSDHLAKINILHEYMSVQNKQVFCRQNYINSNNIKRAVLIRTQLEEYLQQIVKERQKKDFFNIKDNQKGTLNGSGVVGKLQYEMIQKWLKCMAKGSNHMTAKLNKQGKYTILGTGQSAQIHPESVCFYLASKPSLIVFSQVVKTNKIYLKDITPIADS